CRDTSNPTSVEHSDDDVGACAQGELGSVVGRPVPGPPPRRAPRATSSGMAVPGSMDMVRLWRYSSTAVGPCSRPNPDLPYPPKGEPRSAKKPLTQKVPVR